MKKPLFVLAFAVAASPALDAKVYSCGDGCYTSNPKASKGRANLGKQIGSYTGYRPQTEVAIADKIATPVAKPKTQTVAARRTAPVVPRPTPVAMRSNSVGTAVATAPVTTTAAAVRRASGRRTILEQELNNERTALASAQKALADGRVVGATADANHQSKIRKLESAVLDRQQNIQALQRELSRM